MILVISRIVVTYMIISWGDNGIDLSAVTVIFSLAILVSFATKKAKWTQWTTKIDQYQCFKNIANI